ncbi:PaaI family thioesterase [Leeia sp.]|uniref:PaaI family thioesterase n=1 Tax=Leeia sp. TaxID=2884678 RepID=UPI0035B18838
MPHTTYLVDLPEFEDIAIKQFFGRMPHGLAYQYQFVSMARRCATLRVPYQPQLVGDPVSGTVHGGVLTALLDSTCGIAVFCALSEWEMIATLDLRVDFLKRATPGLALTASAECYRMTRQIAFVRGCIYHDDPQQPIATAVATFMRQSS